MKNKFYIGIIILSSLVSTGFSQEVKVYSRLDTNAMLIGDQVKMDIGISMPVSYKVNWPFIPDSILGHIRVLTRSKLDSTFSRDNRILRLNQSFLITTFDSGFYAIPPIRFSIHPDADTAISDHLTEPLFLNVHTLKVDTTQAIKPIKGPMKVSITFMEVLPWILAGMLLIIICFIVVYFIRKRKRDEPIFRLKPRIILMPHEIALMELEKLRTKKLWQNGRIKEYHSELTEIIRRYLEGRFSIMAMEMTSEEILEVFKDNTETLGQSIEKLRGILILADLVKFAKEQPLPTVHENSMEDALAFINDTIQPTTATNEDDLTREKSVKGGLIAFKE